MQEQPQADGPRRAEPRVGEGNFPAGSTTNGNGITSPNSSTWTVSILPFIELQALYAVWDPKVDFNLDTSPGGQRNKKLRETIVPAYLCPTDIDTTQLYQPESGQGTGVQWAAGSYRGVSGVRFIRNVAINQSGSHFWDNPESNLATYEATGELPSVTRGPLHAVLTPTSTATNLRKLPPVSVHEITDGTSNTLLIGEYQTISHPNNNIATSRRTMWCYAYTSYNQSSMTDSALTLIADYNRCASSHSDVNECKRAWGSLHAGDIIQFVRCDGSLADISTDIDLAVFCSMGSIQAEDPR